MWNILIPKDEVGTTTPKEIFGWRIYFLAFSAAWASAMFGYDSAFIGGTITLPGFEEQYGLNSTTATNLSSNIVSTFQGGAFFGSIIGFFLSERFGRKLAIITGGVCFTVGVVLSMIGKLGLLYGSRVLCGLGVGGTSMLIPIYISECSPAAIRGRLVGCFEIMLSSALVVGFWVAYGVQLHQSGQAQWRIPFAIQFVPAGLLLISMPFQIESPRWLVAKGKTEKALKALSYIRHLPSEHPYILNELSDIEASINYELEASGGKASYAQIFREVSEKGVRNRVIIGVCLMWLQNLQGVNALNYFSPTILKAIGFSGSSVKLLATGIYGIVKMVVTITYMFFFVDRTGRRSALLLGALGAGCAMFYLGGYTAVSGSFEHSVPMDSGAQAALAMIYIFAIFYGFSWNGIPWIYSAEILPTRVRTLGNMICVCNQWLSQFVIVYSVPYMIDGITYGTFLFFGCFTIVGFTFAYLFVPETKGMPLEDMDILFGAEAPVIARNSMRVYKDAHKAGLTSLAVEGARSKKGAEFEKALHLEEA